MSLLIFIRRVLVGLALRLPTSFEIKGIDGPLKDIEEIKPDLKEIKSILNKNTP